MSGTLPAAPVMAMEPTSMISSEVHPPDWDTPESTSGSHTLTDDTIGSFEVTEDSRSFIQQEQAPIVIDTRHGSYDLKEQVPMINSHRIPLPKFIVDSVASIPPHEGFTPGQFTVEIDRLSECEGLSGELHKAVISEGEKELNILCKFPPLDLLRRQQFNSIKLFEREINVYANLLPIMFDFQRTKGVTEELNIGFFNVPKWYLTGFDASREEALILMEDLRDRGLSMWNKLEPVNYDHTRLLMIQLGRFHGVSLAMKDQRPDVFEHCRVPDIMVPAIQENEQLMEMFATALESAVSVLEPQEEKARIKMEGLKNEFSAILKSSVEMERAEPYAVLNHGDCWINNLMYGYQDGVPCEVVLLDWQLVRYGSPALDLLYFLFCCTDEVFRHKHYDEMLRIYHTAMTDLLEELGSEAMDVFPFTALLRQLKTFGKFGVIMAALDIPILCTEPADVHSHGDAAAAFEASTEAQQRYCYRMGGVIRDAIKYGYL